jgi:hypothetical protein
MLEDMSLRYSKSGWGITDVDLLQRLATCAKVLGETSKYVVSCLRLLEIIPASSHDERRHFEQELSIAANALDTGTQLSQIVARTFCLIRRRSLFRPCP